VTSLYGSFIVLYYYSLSLTQAFSSKEINEHVYSLLYCHIVFCKLNIMMIYLLIKIKKGVKNIMRVFMFSGVRFIIIQIQILMQLVKLDK